MIMILMMIPLHDDDDDDDLVISTKHIFHIAHSRSFGQRAKVPLQRDEEEEDEGRQRYYSLVAQNTSIL